MPTQGADPDAARRLVVERDLVRTAFEHMTADAFGELPFEAFGPTKTLLKRFFSMAAWTPDDDEDLAEAVGVGEGSWRRELGTDLVLSYGWFIGRFGVSVASTAPADGSAERAPAVEATPEVILGTFEGPVVPEVTPNPRSIRFHVGPIHGGTSRWYEAAEAAADDPGAARLFAEFDEVANVLVGPDFVAVGLRRAPDWEHLLRPVLDVVTDEFADLDAPAEWSGPHVTGGPAAVGARLATGPTRSDAPEAPDAQGPGGKAAGARAPARRLSRLERAWNDLGSLRPGTTDGDLGEVLTAAASEDPARRQVAANLLGEADARVAEVEWARLVVDERRSVRRAAVDAIVDAEREELRPILETALADSDAWVRWKALHGLSRLEPGPSREAVVALAGDPDFRVRFEVAVAERAESARGSS